MNKLNKLIIGLISVNSVFGNTLPPSYDNVIKTNNTLPPTFDCSIKYSIEKSKIMNNYIHMKYKFLNYRYHC